MSSATDALTISPTDLSDYTKMCDRVLKEIKITHPEYPRLTPIELLSYVKRLLPMLRERVNKFEHSL